MYWTDGMEWMGVGRVGLLDTCDFVIAISDGHQMLLYLYRRSTTT